MADVDSDELQEETDESDRLAREVLADIETAEELADYVGELNSQKETMDRIDGVNKLENQLEDLKEEVQAAVGKGNAFDLFVLLVNFVGLKYGSYLLEFFAFILILKSGLEISIKKRF